MGNKLTENQLLLRNNLSSQINTSVTNKNISFPIHIIIPVYNESKSILHVLSEIQRTLQNIPYFISIIDDGSTDDTLQQLEDYCCNKPVFDNIQIIRNSRNVGKGQTLQNGLNIADKNEIIIFIDGDGEHPPREIPRLILPIIKGEADFVIGSRFIKKKPSSRSYKINYLNNGKQFTRIRQFGNKFITFAIFACFRQIISDSQSGFRAFAPGIIKSYNTRYSGFEIETDMLLHYIKQKYRIMEVPIECGLSSRESHMNIIRDSLKILLVILEYRFPKFSRLISLLIRKI